MKTKHPLTTYTNYEIHPIVWFLSVRDVWFLSVRDGTAVNINRILCDTYVEYSSLSNAPPHQIKNQTTMRNSQIVFSSTDTPSSSCMSVINHIRLLLANVNSVFLHSNIVFPQSFSQLHFSVAILGNTEYYFWNNPCISYFE